MTNTLTTGLIRGAIRLNTKAAENAIASPRKDHMANCAAAAVDHAK